MSADGPRPTIAVIVPNFERVEEPLAAIGSALAQQYRGALRVYLVYERRPRDSELIAALPPEVVAIPVTTPVNANPVAFKRNVGLTASQEDLIGFLDDDDLWHPHKIQMQVDAMQKISGAVGCSTGYIRFAGRPAWPQPDHRPPRTVSHFEVLRASTIVTSSVLASGPLVRKLRFDERLQWLAVEDFDLWIRLREQGSIAYVPTPLVAIRSTPSSTSRQGRSWQHAKALAVLAEVRRRRTDHRVIHAAAMRAAVTALSGRGAVDPRADALLDSAFDGHVFGVFDRIIVSAIRWSWRLRLFAWLHNARARLAGDRQ